MLNTDLTHLENDQDVKQVIEENENVMICCGRMGPMCIPVYQAMTKLQQFSFVNAPSFAQKACLTALHLNADEAVGDYRRKRDLVYEGLKDRFAIQRPEGAFYCFPRSPWGTGMEFVMRAIEENVLIVPGGAFSRQDSHFRISYAVDDAKLEAGIEILNKLADAGA